MKRFHLRKVVAQFHLVLAIAASMMMLSSKAAEAAITFTTGKADDGLRYVLVAGEFENRDNLKGFSRTISSYKPHFITFNSPGGSIVKALELGHLIRRLRLNTFQLRANECASACSLAFMGGVQRFAEPGSIGVHKSSFTARHKVDTDTAVSDIQHVTAAIISYMGEMGVDPALLAVALRVESSDIRYLTSKEMAKYRVTTPLKKQKPVDKVVRPKEEKRDDDLAAIPPDQDEQKPKQQPSLPPPVKTPQKPKEQELNLAGRWEYEANCGRRGNIAGTVNTRRLGAKNIYGGWSWDPKGQTTAFRFWLTGDKINISISWPEVGGISRSNRFSFNGVIKADNVIEGRDSLGCSIRFYRSAPSSLVSQIQTELNRLGCDAGPVDGVWGAKSEAALRQFLQLTSLTGMPPEPKAELLQKLRQSSSRVCRVSPQVYRQGIPAGASIKKIKDGFRCVKPGRQTYWFEFPRDGVYELEKQGYKCTNEIF